MTFKHAAPLLTTALMMCCLTIHAHAEPTFVSVTTAWETPDGPYTVEHFVGVSAQGDLLVS